MEIDELEPTTIPCKEEASTSKLESDLKSEETKDSEKRKQYFECHLCKLKEEFEYFGRNPPFCKNYQLLEDAYVIEDPFTAPRQDAVQNKINRILK
ncbi:hypothetical protein GWI33_018449 [Rhynchophorus ferrugineus]|uniref:Cysteine-rich DPF motif domain-containing protein 1 n=1 Tax=Rhynchophorus ferrugineus TaxID=354439 RepID=A0A834M6B7_RHYFE|nr:hypothetical protein GWI33_018449 [Rhynchophorus ferrugineus]